MSKKQTADLRTIKKLKELQCRGVPEVSWRMSMDTLAETRKHFPVSPDLIRVKTIKRLELDDSRCSLLKDL